MHQNEHFAELLIIKTRRAEQLCMLNVYPLCFNSIYKTPESSESKSFKLQQPTFYSVILIKETVT